MSKEKKHKDKDKEKKRRRSEGEGAGSAPASAHKGSATPSAAAAAAPAGTPRDGGGKSSSKKRKSTAAGGDGSQQQQLTEAITAGTATARDRAAAAAAARPPLPAAPTFDPLRDGDRTLTAFRGMRPAPAGADQLRPCWQLEGAEAVAAAPLAPMERVMAGKAELWVVQLPAQLDIEALDGAVFRVDEAAAAHPERPGALGSLELAAESAADMELVRRFTLRQEAPAAAAPLFIAAPTECSRGQLEVLRPARRLVLGEDVAAANGDLISRAHEEAPALQFYPAAMAPRAANALLQAAGRFEGPPGGGGRWEALPAAEGGRSGARGDEEKDVSIAYKYGN